MATYKNLKKSVGKVARKARGKVIKRYFKKGYAPKIGTMYKDIMSLKAMVNAEKKKVSFTSADINYQVSQVYGNTSGHYIVDVTPNPGQGVTTSTKSGASIKWHSAHYDFQFIGQSAMISGMKIKIQLIQIVGQAKSAVPAAILDNFAMTNPYIPGASIYDIGADRNPDYFKNFRVLRTVYTTIKSDSIANEIPISRCTFGMKLKNHHVRTNGNTSEVTEGQVILFITADKGNASATPSTLTGVSTLGANTGVNFRYNFDNYFYDN